MQKPVEIDAFDLKILAVLQDEGNLTNQALSDRINLSPSQCSRRRARLESEEIIKGYRAILDAEGLGFGLTAFVSVMLANHSRDNDRSFRRLVARLDPVQEAHAMTGDMDYLLKVVVTDLKGLSRIINDELLVHQSVQHVRSSIALETIKAGARLALQERRA